MLTITLPLPKVPSAKGVFERTSAVLNDVGVPVKDLNRELNRLLMGYSGIAGNKLFICIPTAQDLRMLKSVVVLLRDKGAVIRRT